MDNCSYSRQSEKAYYFNSIPDFIKDNPDNIIGNLIKKSFEIGKDQTNAWSNQIKELQSRIASRGIDGDIIFEYDIVRLGKRIDVVLLVRHMVFSLEFKNGKTFFAAQDARQAEDYAIDIKNFHKESENLFVCPILVATEAHDVNKEQSIDHYADKQVFLQEENIETVIPKVEKIINKYGTDEKLDFDKRFNSPYHPTPTIISAAIEAYRTKSLTNIANSEAGQENINKCEESLQSIISYAKKNNKKCACFITGVPGAGKTLVGLDVVAKNLSETNENHSVYLSGNGPLVEVLQEALIKSVKEKKIDKKETRSSVGALIQSSFAFKRDCIGRYTPNDEHIVIFDEAQRCWNKQKMIAKHKDESMNFSEPYLFCKIMDRHQDWAVLVCLVGIGQDIYDGEVGISEWFRCVIEDYKNWELYYSDEIFKGLNDDRVNIEDIKKCNRCHCIKDLHLSTSIRSFRADKQAKFVNSLLNNDLFSAKSLYMSINEKFPIFLTRDINKAKEWVKEKVRGSQRCGVIASSSAQRLKPEGIYVPTDIDVKNWFLAPPDDIRSSNMMEVVASEFKIQGLEIDWAVVCWDADLRRKNDKWDFYNFRGCKWVHRNNIDQQRYLLNAYRVLLTRARQGMVIFVPKGISITVNCDISRNSAFYDGIYSYLINCGIQELS